MPWKITDHLKKRHSNLEQESCVLTFGNIQECDIQVESKKKPNILAQIAIEGPFAFVSQGNQITSFFLFCNVTLNDHHFTLERLDCEVEDLLLDVNEEETTTTFFSEYYKQALFDVQELFSTYNASQLEGRENIRENLNKTCFILGEHFWKEHSIYEKNHCRLFLCAFLCLWAQIYRWGLLTFAILDENISEIMVNGKDSIYIEKSGKLRRSQLRFENDDELLATIEQICNAAGKRIDEHHPYCDARLANGSRIHAIIPPLCLNGPCLTIRKFPKLKITMEDLVESGSIPKDLYHIIRGFVESKKNILISGGTSSGKTTLLNSLSRYIAEKERIITIEDSAELQMQQPHVIRLESRKENLEGQGAVTIRDLVRNSLRMRPDRVIIGECRGEEALDMLQAMNTGHDGSMTTIHANTCRDSLRRLEVLVLFSQYDLPSRAIREQIASAIHCIIQQTRFADGKRGVSEIIEVLGYKAETSDYEIRTIYRREK